jgi:cold shock CspA family protein
MRRGKVNFFSFTLGYGFINDSETKEDIFVRKKSLIDKHINPGDEVEYDIMQDTDGQVACNVKRILKKEDPP